MYWLPITITLLIVVGVIAAGLVWYKNIQSYSNAHVLGNEYEIQLF